ncbi:SDR family oxidoreductase [Ruegeria pomeroyi]|nr:SDR family oxidoreductase [Ruegeria pomeroyi]
MLAGRTALVTGAGRGIGREIAARFAREGATVFVNGRDEARTQAAVEVLCAETGGDLRPAVFDVTDAAAVQKGLMAARKQTGQLDVLVNNAGIMEGAMLAMSSDDMLRRTLNTNVEATFFVVRTAARLMMRQEGGGSIVNLASIIGRVGVEGYSAYAASKAAVIGMTKALAKELAPQNIRVNALAPGFIETDLTSGIEGDQRARVLAQIRMGRAGTPADVAGPALFLASDLSSYVTGQVLGVDGAMVT